MTIPKIDSKGGITRYLQLYAALSQELADGAIDPGALMPSEPSLVRKYRVSRTTVRRALARLESEGRILRRRGSGTFATGHQEGSLRPGERVSQLHGQAEPATRGVSARRLDAQRVETPAVVQKSMQGFGSPALMVRTLRLLRGQPFALATSYFVERISNPLPVFEASGEGKSLPRTGARARITQTLIERTTQRSAQLTASSEQIVTAIGADAFTARELGVPMSAPLLQVRRLLYDAQRQPVEYQDVRYRADLFELRTPITPDD